MDLEIPSYPRLEVVSDGRPEPPAGAYSLPFFYDTENMSNFWKKLKKRFFCLAPMADVTDVAFRRVIATYGKPDVMWNEFVSVEGLSHPKGREKLLPNLSFSDIERPIVAQIFGADPLKFQVVAELIQELGYDGIDINMGCPVGKIVKQGSGADLINDPELAKKIIRATKAGAGKLPVSVKTRLGSNVDTLDTWLPVLLEEGLSAITIHARTAKEMSGPKARWERISRAKEIARECGSDTLIIGNGDVSSLSDARHKATEYGVDGVMVGRGVFGNPWFFNPDISRDELEPKERMRVMLEHSRLFDELVSHKSFAVMRKHFKAYTHGMDNVSELRDALMKTENSREVERVLRDFRYI